MLEWILDNKLWLASTVIIPVVIWLAKKWFKPRLIVKLSNSKYTKIKNPYTGFDFQWAQVDVGTKSGSMIKNCRTYINRIQFQSLELNSAIEDLIDSRIPIAWANSNFQLSCDIAGQGVKALIYRFSGDGLDVLRDEKLKTTKELCDKGIYWFHIQSEAGNAKPGQIIVKVSFEKQSNTPEIEEIRS